MVGGGFGRQANLMRRLRRAEPPVNDTFTLDDESSARSILSSEDKLRWATQALTENVRMGAKTMLLVCLCYLVLALMEYALARQRSFYCTSWRSKTSVNIELIYEVVRFAFPLATIPVFYSCMTKPRLWLHVFTVSCFFFYLIILGLPAPVLIVDNKPLCSLTTTSSLREHSTVHLLMAWILLTPSVLPTKNALHLTWGYIAVGYVGASLVCHFYNGDGKYFAHTDDWLVDMSYCTVLLMLVNAIAINKKYYIEKGQFSKFVMDLKHKESTRRMFNILEYMVPVHLIAPMLKNPGKVIAEQVECASILFIMFVDFDQTASRLEPHELLDFLNHHFTLFDTICAKHGVTKIETVGEEYVCAVGVVPADVEGSRTRGHQEILGRLITVAAEILKVAEEDEKVDLKMGIHTGPVVAGVIGNKLPRFRLFGDTINTAARMMQKGLPGELQFGEETYQCLPQGVEVEHRGRIEMKGKGQVTTYLLKREKSSPAQASAATPAAARASRKVAFAEDSEPKHSGRPSGLRASQAYHARGSRASRKSICDLLAGGMSRTASAASAVSHFQTSMHARPSGFEASRPEPAPAAADASRQGLEVELTCLRRQSGSAGPRPGAPGSPLLRPEEASESGNLEDLSGTWSNASATASAVSLSSRTEDGAANEAFEKAVQEVCAASLHGDSATSEEEEELEGSLLDRMRRWLRSIGPGWNSFPKEMEEAFCSWYHESAIVKKLDKRLELHLLMGSVLTTVDILYTVLVSRAFEKEPYRTLRLPIFLASRLLVCVIVTGWRAAFDQEWIRKAPKDVQLRILLSYGLIGVLWFISYDVLSDQGQVKGTNMDVFALLFVPVYLTVTTLHPLLFVHSCAFTIEAALLMYLSGILFRNLQFDIASVFVFVGNSVLNNFFAHTSEKTLRARYKANASISLAQDRIEHILNTLMPVQVVEELRENELHTLRAHTYRCATVAQSDLCGFTKLASTRRPEEVVEFIGELFGAFDELTDEYEIYKVETVGDAYIAGQADVPLTYKNSPVSVVLFGLDMIRAVHEWSRKRGENVSCRVGVHSGECVGGIVGSEMQRYHLFGRLMTGLEVLESTAPEGRVQVSIACKEAVECQLREECREVSMFEPRQEARLTTSKGEVHEFEEVGGPTFVAKSYAQIRGQLTV